MCVFNIAQQSFHVLVNTEDIFGLPYVSFTHSLRPHSWLQSFFSFFCNCSSLGPINHSRLNREVLYNKILTTIEEQLRQKETIWYHRAEGENQKKTSLERIYISLRRVWFSSPTVEKFCGLARLELVWSCQTSNKPPSGVQAHRGQGAGNLYSGVQQESEYQQGQGRRLSEFVWCVWSPCHEDCRKVITRSKLQSHRLLCFGLMAGGSTTDVLTPIHRLQPTPEMIGEPLLLQYLSRSLS